MWENSQRYALSETKFPYLLSNKELLTLSRTTMNEVFMQERIYLIKTGVLGTFNTSECQRKEGKHHTPLQV